MSETAAADTEAPPSSSGPKWIPMALLANSGILLAVLGVMLFRHPDPAAAPAAAAGEAAAPSEGAAPEHKGGDVKVGPTIKLADLTVRLRGNDSEHFARFAFDIELSDEKDRDVATQLIPQIRDAFIIYLSDRSLEDLEGSVALQKIKASLSEKAVAILGTKARALYISDLVLQ